VDVLLAVREEIERAERSTVRYGLRILERDPFDEAAHLELVSMLIQAGRLGEARRAYRTYVARMRELGV
jgi:DNA-binding SARP family transcriptional activator